MSIFQEKILFVRKKLFLYANEVKINVIISYVIYDEILCSLIVQNLWIIQRAIFFEKSFKFSLLCLHLILEGENLNEVYKQTNAGSIFGNRQSGNKTVQKKINK